MRLEHMPAPYIWVVKRNLAGFEPFTSLQPWYFLPEDGMFEATATWPAGPSKTPLVAFARRQDCDDIACFEFGVVAPAAVVVIEGWTNSGYEIITTHPTFWDWLKSVVDDMAEWSEIAEGDEKTAM